MNATFPAGDRSRLEVSLRSKSYAAVSGPARQALREIAFVLKRGQIAAIVGPSGCGKTTLLRIIAGLDRSYDGVVSTPAAGRLAVVFQEPRLLPWRRVDDNVSLAAPTTNPDEIAELFAALGLAEHRRHFPRELSLGLARRVALVRALAVHPDLLLLDEPFASLDSATVANLRDKIIESVEARPMITLLVTHDIESAISLADSILVLSPAPGRLLGEITIPAPRARLTSAAMTEIAAQVSALR